MATLFFDLDGVARFDDTPDGRRVRAVRLARARLALADYGDRLAVAGATLAAGSGASVRPQVELIIESSAYRAYAHDELANVMCA